MIMKIMIMIMKMILQHSILFRYTIYIIPDTLQPVFRPLNPLLESKQGLNFENICQIFQDWHQKLNRLVQPNNHWKRIHYVLPLIVLFQWSPKQFMPILKNLTSPNFSNIATFGIVVPLPQRLVAPNQVVDPQVFYMKLTVWSRRTSMTCQKNSHPQTL